MKRKTKSGLFDTTAILTAAGSGTRFLINKNAGTPKQFVNLLGKPVILYSLLSLQKASSVKNIIIASNRNYFDFIHSLIYKYKITKASILVEGGKTRFDSAKRAFSQIIPNNGFVLIHDAARPNISSKLIDEIVSFAAKSGNTVIGTKITDTIKLESKGRVLKTIDRKFLWTVQTPQVFRYKDLYASYKKNRSSKHTDESSMVESCGYTVALFEGPKENIKLTDANDYRLLKSLMK